ncbi:MAG: class I SAM-dependent methyltransferase [Candidatus Odinarchaeota archaeon]
MMQNQDKKEISIKDQMKKFLIKGFYGFNTIICFGIGKRLGIFDYLKEKAKKLSCSGSISSISFTLEEIVKNLNLDPDYLDSWVHLSLDCGIFEIDNIEKRSVKTAPYVYDLLINEDHIFYVGTIVSLFYYFAPFQDLIIEFFKTGGIPNANEIPEEFLIDAAKNSANWGNIIERLFSKYFKKYNRILRKEGRILEVGCGYGFNLKNWSEKYKGAKLIGIDIDSRAVSHSKKLMGQYNLDDRVEVLDITIDKFAKSNTDKFDLILLNQVLHEMNHDEVYRRSVFEDLYSLLKDEGILIVGETMIPDMFSPKRGFQLFDIMHKFLEAKFAKFYDEKSFKDFIESTPFKKAELIRERGEYFWAIQK